MSRPSKLLVEAGQVIADRYRLESPIERGAMGAVWRATHVHLESPVAIKFLNPAIADDPEMLRRFLREAQSAALVRSSHVVQVFDYGVDSGAPYIAMELLMGQSLDSRLDQGPLTPSELSKIFGEVAHAVAVAHDVGVIHRDLKPGNVFVVREGGHEITKVLDFGIAKWRDQKLSSPTSPGTHSGVTIGTPHYMSPEQARGDRNLDHRTDIWSLAVLAFECFTGRAPFQGEAFGDLLVNICTNEPLLPSSLARVPAGFDAWFLKGVMKDPDARFANAREMASALHAILSSEASTSSSSELKLFSGPVSASLESERMADETRRSRSPVYTPTVSLRRRGYAKAFVVGSSLAAGALLLWLLASPQSVSVSPVTPVLAPAGEPVAPEEAVARVEHQIPVEPAGDVLTENAALAENLATVEHAAQPAPELEAPRSRPQARRATRTPRATRAVKKRATQTFAARESQPATTPEPTEGSLSTETTSPSVLDPQSTTKAALPAFDPFSERL
jgi:eukaryotic-like serine/threonine-protein kinase